MGLKNAYFSLTMTEFVNFFKEPRDRFPSWRAGMTTLFDAPARQST
jgi:hypothetical protein